MKRATLVGILLAVSASAMGASDLVEIPKQYLIHRPSKAVVVDGKLDEWDTSGFKVISALAENPLIMTTSGDHTNPVASDADFSGLAGLAWDEDYLYVAGRMKDDHLMGVRPDSAGNQGPAGWRCDSLMVAVASFHQTMKANSPYQRTPMLGVRYAVPKEGARGKYAAIDRILDKRGPYWVLTENSKWASTETDDGYIVEAAIPWKDLRFEARPVEEVFRSMGP